MTLTSYCFRLDINVLPLRCICLAVSELYIWQLFTVHLTLFHQVRLFGGKGVITAIVHKAHRFIYWTVTPLSWIQQRDVHLPKLAISNGTTELEASAFLHLINKPILMMHILCNVIFAHTKCVCVCVCVYIYIYIYIYSPLSYKFRHLTAILVQQY